MAGDVLVVGDVMTDIIVRPEGALVIGSDRRAHIETHPGGSGANQAVWLGSMGAPVRFVARVGATDVGPLTARFAQWGVTALLRGDPVAASGALVTLVDPSGERSFLTDRGANLNLCPADLPETLLDGAGLLLVSGYSLFAPGPRAAVLALLRAARERGVPTAIDPASVGFLQEVGIEAFLEWTEGIGTIFANADEALALTGELRRPAQLAALARNYGRVVIKLGAEGALIGDRSGIIASATAPQVAVIDTTGAGDAFAAGFIVAELSGANAPAALAAAITAGARAVTQMGGQPSTCSG